MHTRTVDPGRPPVRRRDPEGNRGGVRRRTRDSRFYPAFLTILSGTLFAKSQRHVARQSGDTLTLRRSFLLAVLLQALASGGAIAQAPQPKFGGKYAELDARRQRLVDGWVVRFEKTTGQSIEPGPFYDDIVSLSTKTTFEAVTHALMTTHLTDQAGAEIGDALALVERIDAGPGRGRRRARRSSVSHLRPADCRRDRQAVALAAVQAPVGQLRVSQGLSHQLSRAGRDAVDSDLDRDRPAKRGYRCRLPLVDFSGRAVNGHLTASNSDVRAGNNYDRHVNRWTGFQNWWQGFFGVRLERPPDSADASSRTSSRPCRAPARRTST